MKKYYRLLAQKRDISDPLCPSKIPYTAMSLYVKHACASSLVSLRPIAVENLGIYLLFRFMLFASSSGVQPDVLLESLSLHEC